MCCCLLFHLYRWGTFNRATHPAACEWQQGMFHRNAHFWDRPIFPSQPNNHCPPGDSLEEKWRWKIRARGTERGKAEDDSGGESNPSIDCVCPLLPCEWGLSRGYAEMLKKMRHNTRGSSDRMKGSLRSNERNEDSKGQSSLLCLQVGALAVQGTRADKAEGQTEGCRAWSFPLLLQVSVCDTPSDCGAQSWEQRSSGSSEPTVQQHLTPTGWVTNLRLYPFSPRPGNTLGRF